MLKYLKESFRRKKARRVTQEYAFDIVDFNLKDDGKIQFASWNNPLVKAVNITQSEVNFYKKFVKKGDVIIDIGANIGDTTVPMSIAAGKEGVTFGFDPNPYVFKGLEINATLNKEKSNIIPVLNAISTQEEEFYYVSSEASFANGGISKTKESTHGKFVYPHKIKGINLLEFLESKHPELAPRITFIKIDAEGYDKEIIKSISDLIKKYKPTLVAESFGASPDKDKRDLFETISQHGYDLFYFEDFFDTCDIQKISTAEDLINWKETINVYAIPKS